MKLTACFLGLVAALAIAAEDWKVQAQVDEPPTSFAKGAIDEPAASYASRPQTPLYRAFLPANKDLSPYFPEPGDQGRQASCVGWAVGYAARAYYAISQEHRPVEPSNIPSPAYIYNRILSTPGNCATGSTIAGALDLLHQGALSLADYPYDARRCPAPSAAERARARDFRIATVRTVKFRSPDQVKGEIAQGNPVIISFVSRPAFERLRQDAVYNALAEPSDGNHALTVVGYDDARQAFKVINSWGAKWGKQGYGWIGYRTFVTDVNQAYVMGPLRGEPPQPSPTPVPQPVRPPDPTPAPAPVAFDFVKCGIVKSRSTASGLEVQGFVGTVTELKQVEERAKALKAATVDVAVRPWPQCEALMTLERGLDAGDRPKIHVVRSSHDAPLAAASNFLIELESPATASFMHVTYIQADGKAVHLMQPEATSLAPLPPHSKQVLGDGRNGGPRFTVSAPFGDEIVIVVASKSPLFADERPTTETEREFLTALRAAVMAQPDSSSAKRIFAADFDAVKTVMREP